MVDIDSLLSEEKQKVINLQAPPEMELRLKRALHNETKPKPKPKKNMTIIAGIIAFLVLFSYNYDAIAYYSKKILGYDDVMNDALKDLNEKRQGQEINEKFVFNNGTAVTLDGIMLDENRMIAFYTVTNPQGNINDYNLNSTNMQGIARYYGQGGYGKSNEEFTEVKWIYDFEPPGFFERNLTFNFDLRGPNQFYEGGSIKFRLDRSKAMGFTIKQDIDRRVKLNNTDVKFNTITASPTQTVIRGEIGTALEYLNNVRQNKYYRFGLEYDLLANGKIIGKQGGGMSTSAKGIEFEGRFDPLPKGLEKLEIKLNRVTESDPVAEIIELDVNNQDVTREIAGNKIIINEVNQRNNNTYVTITTQDHVLLEKVFLLVDGIQVSLEQTLAGDNEKSLDGVIYYRRTLEFLASGDKYVLLVNQIRHMQEFSELINIPLN